MPGAERTPAAPGLNPPYDVVAFDCDSTLSAVEGIDELARRSGCFEALAEMTRQAMDGVVPLQAVYARRLDILRPRRDALQWLGQRYVAELISDAGPLIAALQGLGKQVHIISGGLRPAVLMLARHLGVADGNVHAVDLEFEPDGRYRDFDSTSPLTRQGGKAALCTALGLAAARTVMVGDGVTDLDVQDVDIPLIGFGGVVPRAPVRQGAAAFVAGPGLAGILEFALTPEERQRCRWPPR